MMVIPLTLAMATVLSFTGRVTAPGALRGVNQTIESLPVVTPKANVDVEVALIPATQDLIDLHGTQGIVTRDGKQFFRVTGRNEFLDQRLTKRIEQFDGRSWRFLYTQINTRRGFRLASVKPSWAASQLGHVNEDFEWSAWAFRTVAPSKKPKATSKR